MLHQPKAAGQLALPPPRPQVSSAGHGRAGAAPSRLGGNKVRGSRLESASCTGGSAGEVAPRVASGRAPSPAPHAAAASRLPQVRRSLPAQLSSVEPRREARPDNRWAAAPQAQPGQARASRPQPSAETPSGRGARSYLRHVGRATGSHRRGGSRPEPGCAPGSRGSRRCLRRRLGGNAQEPPERATTPRSAPSRRPARRDGRGEAGGGAPSRECAAPRPPSPGSAREADPRAATPGYPGRAREVRERAPPGTLAVREKYLLFYCQSLPKCVS